jgi:hypothetical protein
MTQTDFILRASPASFALPRTEDQNTEETSDEQLDLESCLQTVVHTREQVIGKKKGDTATQPQGNEAELSRVPASRIKDKRSMSTSTIGCFPLAIAPLQLSHT